MEEAAADLVGPVELGPCFGVLSVSGLIMIIILLKKKKKRKKNAASSALQSVTKSKY